MNLREQLEDKLQNVDTGTIEIIEEMMKFHNKNINAGRLTKEIAMQGIIHFCSCLHELKKINLKQKHYVIQIAEEVY